MVQRNARETRVHECCMRTRTSVTPRSHGAPALTRGEVQVMNCDSRAHADREDKAVSPPTHSHRVIGQGVEGTEDIKMDF